MTQIIHPSYRDDARGPFPFEDRATLTSSDGYIIDQELLVDAMLYPPLNSDPLYLSAVVISETAVRFEVSSIYTPGLVCSGSAEFDAAVAEMFDPAGRQSGLLLIDADRLAQFRTWPLGEHTFPVAAATFAVTCVSPERRLGVTGVADTAGVATWGDVWLVGERGVTLTVNDGVIYVHAVGDPLWRRRICDGSSAFAASKFLKTINDIPPDEFGAWTLGVGTKLNRKTAVRINVDGAVIVLSVAGGK